MKAMKPIYTIGYGNRSMSEFIQILRQYHIVFLIDVRSRPTSRSQPEYSRQQLEYMLKLANVRYVFLGDALGDSPRDKRGYTNGQVDYAKVQKQLYFQRGIKKVQNAWEQRVPVMIMCSEPKPEECHRSALVGEALARLNIPVMHIDHDNELVEHETVMDRLAERDPH